MKTTALPFALLAVFTACSSQSELDVGDETKVTGQALSDYAANWDGYIEAFKVSGDGSDRVRVTLDENGEGTIRFGEQTLHGPATDPNDNYPTTPWLHNNSAGVQSGFEYPILSAVVTSSRLIFDFDTTTMETWCALQPPEAVRGWSCSASGSVEFDPNTGEATTCKVDVGQERIEVDCEAMSSCRRCECDEVECHALKQVALQFDGALSPDTDALTGTLVLANGERVAVRLTR